MQLLREKNNFHLPKIATSWAALEDVEKELEWLIDYALYWNFFLIFCNQFCKSFLPPIKQLCVWIWKHFYLWIAHITDENFQINFFFRWFIETFMTTESFLKFNSVYSPSVATKNININSSSSQMISTYLFFVEGSSALFRQ